MTQATNDVAMDTVAAETGSSLVSLHSDYCKITSAPTAVRLQRQAKDKNAAQSN